MTDRRTLFAYYIEPPKRYDTLRRRRRPVEAKRINPKFKEGFAFWSAALSRRFFFFRFSTTDKPNTHKALGVK